MPIYEFKCTKCSKQFEKILKLDERDNVITCPTCEGEAVIMVSVPSPARFRGRGFHINDYGKG